MSAVSLSEAWNDPPPPNATVQSDSNPVSARAALPLRTNEEHRRVDVVNGDDDAKSEPPLESGRHITRHAPAIDPSLELLLQEVQAFRHDAARRCMVYLAVGGVLFSILFVYIDRLHQQIRFTNSFVVQHQQPLLKSIAPEMSRTPYKLPPQW